MDSTYVKKNYWMHDDNSERRRLLRLYNEEEGYDGGNRKKSTKGNDTKDDRFSILIADDGKVDGHHTVVNTKSVVVATDYNVARSLLQDMPGLESLKSMPKLSQRSVGCLLRISTSGTR